MRRGSSNRDNREVSKTALEIFKDFTPREALIKYNISIFTHKEDFFMRTLKRFASAALALTLAAGMNIMPVFADEAAPANGNYTATIHFHNASNPANYSMCDSIFAHDAEISLTDDQAELTFYVAYPIPAFKDQGADGTIKDVKMTYGDIEYTGTSDIETKAEKTFDTKGELFGINAGDELATQAVTVDFPKEAVASFSNGIKTSAYVNVFMNTTVDFVVKITDMKKVTVPTNTSKQSAEVTADVAAAAPSYDVTIPESISMGTLSADQDNKKTFTVNVTAENLGTGKVEVKTAASGELLSNSNKLAFANNFGTQSTSETKDLTGTITVKAADVKKAAAGNYTGTANFTINYYAGE